MTTLGSSRDGADAGPIAGAIQSALEHWYSLGHLSRRRRERAIQDSDGSETDQGLSAARSGRECSNPDVGPSQVGRQFRG